MALEQFHPRDNSQLFGFTSIEEELARWFNSGKLHHSLLFSGAKGIGKATLAYRFARYIFSGGADLRALENNSFSLFAEPDATIADTGAEGALFMPESHGIFKRVAANSHSDLLSIEPLFDAKKDVFKDEITADAARKISDFLSLTSAEASHRVVIIDAADQLNEKAANALLKSIEEPPSSTFIILICHNPLSILPTLRSRCRAITLKTPDLNAFGAVLAQRMPTIDLQQYGALHTLSQGSPGFAITLATFDAINLYEIVARHATQKQSLAATIDLAAELTASKRPEAWCISKYILLALIERCINISRVKSQPIYADEISHLDGLYSRLGSKKLFTLREHIQQLLNDTDTLNLDKTQAMRLLLSAA